MLSATAALLPASVAAATSSRKSSAQPIRATLKELEAEFTERIEVREARIVLHDTATGRHIFEHLLPLGGTKCYAFGSSICVESSPDILRFSSQDEVVGDIGFFSSFCSSVDISETHNIHVFQQSKSAIFVPSSKHHRSHWRWDPPHFHVTVNHAYLNPLLSLAPSSLMTCTSSVTSPKSINFPLKMHLTCHSRQFELPCQRKEHPAQPLRHHPHRLLLLSCFKDRHCPSLTLVLMLHPLLLSIMGGQTGAIDSLVARRSSRNQEHVLWKTCQRYLQRRGGVN